MVENGSLRVSLSNGRPARTTASHRDLKPAIFLSGSNERTSNASTGITLDYDHFLLKAVLTVDEATDLLTASYLEKLEPDSGYGRLSKIINKVSTLLLDCEELLRSNQNLEADDKFMSSKELI